MPPLKQMNVKLLLGGDSDLTEECARRPLGGGLAGHCDVLVDRPTVRCAAGQRKSEETELTGGCFVT